MDVASCLNQILVEAVIEGDYSHPIFYISKKRKGPDEAGGIFWNDFSEFYDVKNAPAINQLVAHTAIREPEPRIIENDGFKAVNIDIGIARGFGNNRGWMEIDPESGALTFKSFSYFSETEAKEIPFAKKDSDEPLAVSRENERSVPDEELIDLISLASCEGASFETAVERLRELSRQYPIWATTDLEVVSQRLANEGKVFLGRVVREALKKEVDRNRTYALILAGGGGRRSWPWSTTRVPKQLRCYAKSGRTLLQETVWRLLCNSFMYYEYIYVDRQNKIKVFSYFLYKQFIRL